MWYRFFLEEVSRGSDPACIWWPLEGPYPGLLLDGCNVYGNAGMAEPLPPRVMRGFEHWTRNNLDSFSLLLTRPEAVHFTVYDPC